MHRRVRVFLLTSFFVVIFAVLSVAQDAPVDARARKALSPIRGNLVVHGLQEPVKVLRDRWGVAHIYAKNQHDLFFAQGFVVAQDRLFQMELWKRAGQGRLAEVLGPSAVQRDINARLLRYRGDMKAEYESYAPDTEAILSAFTDGINAEIRSLTANTGPGLPIEFQLTGFEPEPWKPQDCLNRMAAFAMTGNAFSELRDAELIAKLGVQKASAVLSLDPKVTLDPAAGVDFGGLSPSLLKNLIGSDARIEFPSEGKQGSNDWTISGRLTSTGKPMLANDPHRVMALPSLRYIIHLVAPGWDVIGAGEPGLPGVAVGHNQHVAWGFTIFGLDQQDLYIEDLNPQDPLQYKTPNGWARMQVEHESIAVKGKPPVEVDLKFTRHGPVLWEDGKRALALRWVGAEPGTAGYLASLAVDRATDWDEFENAMKRWKVPSENIVYADTAGNIGEHSTGLAPLRKNWTGLLPVPGAPADGEGEYEWSGYVPNSELPHSFNPPGGFIATANHKMIPQNYPYNVGFEWAPPDRVHRIEEVISGIQDSGKKITLEDMEKLQTDVVSLAARQLVDLLKQSSPNSTAATQMIQRWDATLSRESGAAALYEVWLKELQKVVAEKEGVASLEDDFSLENISEDLSDPSPQVFGDNAVAGRNRVLQQTLEFAWKQTEQLLGNDPQTWSWGRLHTIRFRHSLDRLPDGATLLDLGPLSRPGDGDTVNATWAGKKFEQEGGASYREILDAADWDHSLAVNTPGQSGQPGSSHYSDLLPLWDKGEYFPLLYSRKAVEMNSQDRLMLAPN
ncbi:MAG: penicillin acylase family protein [Candidatus Sulfotelmatobacter sp.]